MSRSSLVSYVNLSPNCSSPRERSIDTITIHCYVGQVSVERMAKSFCDPAKKKSPNYGIGVDGRIALFVEEENRSWCSSSKSNDARAVTIECACDSYSPFAVNVKVYDSLIVLCEDICRRDGIKELKWKADKSLIGKVDQQNMTVHRWFAKKACPGAYLYNRMGAIAKQVNDNLNTESKWEKILPFKVRIKAKNLKIRGGPGTNYQNKGAIPPGVYTIVEVQDGQGSKIGFGKLKSGVGWISLDYAEILA